MISALSSWSWTTSRSRPCSRSDRRANRSKDGGTIPAGKAGTATGPETLVLSIAPTTGPYALRSPAKRLLMAHRRGRCTIRSLPWPIDQPNGKGKARRFARPPRRMLTPAGRGEPTPRAARPMPAPHSPSMPSSSPSGLRPAVFLDRDGVINIDHGYVFRPADLAFTPTAAAGIALLNAAGVLVIVVTNQSGGRARAVHARRRPPVPRRDRGVPGPAWRRDRRPSTAARIIPRATSLPSRSSTRIASPDPACSAAPCATSRSTPPGAS